MLADAGVRASGYSPDHVRRKLSSAFEEFGDSEARLDLVIGTHYDADHLDGLVPIINDDNIKITEVWLPPVANDSERHGFDEPVAENHLLARQFYSDTNRGILGRYLRTKELICRYVRPRGDQDNEPIREQKLNDEILREENLDRARGIFLRYRMSHSIHLIAMSHPMHLTRGVTVTQMTMDSSQKIWPNCPNSSIGPGGIRDS